MARACASSITPACEFRYRESIFKRQKHWIIFSTKLALDRADAAELREIAADIVKVRNEKFPVTMKCAGSIFKNFLLRELPPAVAAQVPGQGDSRRQGAGRVLSGAGGRQGMRRGDIHVADYHANLIYNAGGGTAASCVR